MSLMAFSVNVFAQQSVSIKKTLDEITVDGEADEAVWAEVEALTPQSIIGAEAPEDEYDFSASWKVLWDETNLYFFFEVTDADWYPNDHWASDQVEVYFRLGDGEFGGDNLFNEAANGYIQVALRTTEDGVASGGYQQDPEKYKAVTVETNDGWKMEASIQWDILTSQMEIDVPEIAAGLEFNLDPNIQDNDSDPEGDDYPGGFTQGYWSSAAHLWNPDWSTAGEATLSDETVGSDGNGGGGGEPTASVSEYGTMATLPMASADVTIDGTADEDIWSNEALESYTIESMLSEDLVAPEDEYDLSASWKGFYTETSLYLLVEVTDADIIYPSDNVAGWAADKLEVYLGFAPGETDAENLWATCDVGLTQVPFLVEPDPEDGVPCAKETFSGREYAVVETADGYVMEIKLDFNAFMDGTGNSVTISDGLIFNFDILVNDNDSDDTDERSQYYWSADTHLWNYPWNGTQGAIKLGESISVSVKDVKADRVNVFPNPVNDILIIRGNVDNVVIYDLIGKEILSAKMSGNTLSLANLQQGIYILKAVKAGEVVATEKIQVK